MKDHTKGLLITALGVLFIVPDSLFVRLIETDAITIAFWRNLVSGAVALAGLVALRGWSTIATIRGTGRYGVIYSVCVAATGILFVLAVSLTSVANVVFIIAAMPVFAALFSWIALKEPVTRRMILTMATVGMGLAVIAYGSGEHERASLEGDLVAIGVACLFAIALTAARKGRAVSMVPAVPLAFLAAAALLAPFADPWSVPAAQWWMVAVHGGVVVVFSMSLLAIGPRYITSAEVALLILLESVLAPLLVWAVLGEYPGRWALAGGAIVIGALLFSNLWVLMRGRRRSRVKAPAPTSI
ncbi:MAG TPA: DMT family transporter [Alphaproteobacteria bacterium]|nr:DMT family transporter [Alphaproteobacteria bacterium]